MSIGIKNSVSSTDASFCSRSAFNGSNDSDAIVVFSRNSSTGTLTFVEAITDAEITAGGLDGARSISISPDEAHVYVASETGDAISVFNRDSLTGTLTFVESLFDTTPGIDGLNNVFGVFVSPDNKHWLID